MKNKIQSLIEDFQDTFDNMPETLSEDAKKDMEARAVKKEMKKDKKSFTKATLGGCYIERINETILISKES